MKATTEAVQIDRDTVRVEIEGSPAMELPLNTLSDGIVDWFLEGRQKGYESLMRGEGPGLLFSRHLPVVATTGEVDLFSIRMAHKGVGFIPRDEILSDIISDYEALLERTRDLPASESLSERLKAVSSFYSKPGNLDTRLLGSLEIFAGETYANIKRTPLASLLFTDPGPPYTSFQFDCAVQIAEPPDPRFRFLQLARGLFERDPFHVTQPGVRCAYLFWITGVIDKTPRPLPEGHARHRL